MFTGIIQTIGTVTTCNPFAPQPGQGDAASGTTVGITVPNTWVNNDPLVIGESIALNGVCTTVTTITECAETTTFTVDLSPETLAVTTLGRCVPGNPLNLERAMRANDRFGGHWVTGHVDATATLIDHQPDGSSHRLYFRLNQPEVAEFLLPKGSITINGISLTINHIQGAVFDVAIIPHTWAVTTIGQWQLDDSVNIECDHLVKIVSQLHQPYTHAAQPKPTQPKPNTNDPISEAFCPSTMGTSQIHTGRWFNLQ